MEVFEVTPIRDRDEQGRLVSSGAYWTEFQATSYALLFGGGVALFPLGLILAVANPFFALFAWAGGVVAIVAAKKGSRLPRSLIFTDEGKMLALNGLPFHPGSSLVEGHHDAIVSVEATGRTYPDNPSNSSWKRDAINVALIAAGGETIYVSRDLSPEQARNVAVQLTLALLDIRQSGAEGRQVPPVPPKDPDDDVIN